MKYKGHQVSKEATTISPRRASQVALFVAGLAVLVMAIASIVYWRELIEAWYLRRFETGNAADKRAAVERLGEIRSARAVPVFMKALGEADENLQRRIVTASKAIGIEAVPVIFQAMNKASASEGNRALEHFVVETLTEMGPSKLVGEKTNDPMLRELYGDALAEKGRYEEALGEYLWCFDHGSEHTIGYVGVRVSFLLGRVMNLADRYPLALRALQERRDHLEEKVLKDSSHTSWLKQLFGSTRVLSEAVDFACLNRELKEPERTLSVFRKLRNMKGGTDPREAMLQYLIDPLLEERGYAEIVEAAGDAEAKLSRRIMAFGELKLRTNLANAAESHSVQPAEAFHRRSIVEEGGKLYEAYLGSDQPEDASGIAIQLIEFSPKAETYATLVRHATRAGKEAQVKELLASAEKALSVQDLEKVQQAVANPERPAEPRG